MAETETQAPRVINKSGTLKMDDKVAATKQTRDISGRKMERRNRRDRVRADAGKKEYDSITIAVHLQGTRKPRRCRRLPRGRVPPSDNPSPNWPSENLDRSASRSWRPSSQRKSLPCGRGSRRRRSS